ncbi:MAG: succinate--CoA ligase subunit alpha [Desulfobacteraceae bacterium]|nr:succinate--CoA ligase subunit alpha [Desulfobacteraceae bacterium]
MSILVDKDTRVAVQGITGRQGSFHTRLMLEEGTNIVAGVVPGKGGQIFEGIPVYDTILEARLKQDINASIGFIPPPFAAQSILDAIDAGLEVVVSITDGIPIHDMLKVKDELKDKRTYLIGPNTPGLITPRQAKLGIMPSKAFKPGCIGVISRSGSLSYEVCDELSKANLGQSTVVGVGGDSIPGTTFADLIPLFEADSETKGIAIVGEIGGVAEEKAAKIIKEFCSKPVVALMGGESAPPGKAMGHAGAIVTRGKGTFKSKVEAFRDAGVRVVHKPKDLVQALNSLLSAHR